MSPSGERGSVGLWMLGLGLLLLTLGGITLDLWSLLAERRELAAMADAAAVAAASGIDEERWRTAGELRLDPELARQRAVTVLAAQPTSDDLDLSETWFEADLTTVVVRLEREVELTLLRFAHPDPVTVRASARSEAELRR